jgi:signal transduction histidine kinase
MMEGATMSKSQHILGVDDNPRNLAILRKTLAGEFDFVTAASGEEALEIAPRLRPDVVLLDIMMPGIDGYETCRRMRARPELSSTKIIMVSAKAMTSERIEGYAAGADDYVVKPFDQDELLAKVRVFLRLKTVEEVDRLKSDLLTLLGHETRTPLTHVMSPILLLLGNPDLDDKQRQLLTLADAGAHRLLALVERVSFLSELKAGAVPFRMGTYDLGIIAWSAIESMRWRADEAKILLTFNTEASVAAEVDPMHLQRALEVLLDNAIHFSPAGERVEVRTWTDGPRSGVVVSDHGPGIELEMLPRVFDEFVVGDIQHHSKGLGLSLATARAIVEQHGGSLTAESEPGRGATFRVSLPGAAVMPAAA